MNIRCVIIDDEPPAVRLISSYVQQVPELEIAATCSNAIDAFKVLREQRIDLIFLDIKMPKLIGTDFIRSIQSPPKVIVITAYRDYALDGYDLDVVDYLLKPVSFTRFMKAVSKAIKLIGVEGNFSAGAMENGSAEDAFLYFKVDRDMQKVLLHDILFIESCREYVKIHLEDKRQLLVRQSITSMEKLLSPHRFIRVHRSYIVTIEKVASFNAMSLTVNTHKVPIGRLYKNEVENALRQL